MDKANAALAQYLASQQKPVHLVAFSVDSNITALPSVVTSYATMPAHSLFLGGFRLARLGRWQARQATQKFAGTRVLVNGIGCDWPDINWVHWVHHCWDSYDSTAPIWFKLKHQIETRWAVRAERALLPKAKLVIANSERTRRDLINLVGLEAQNVALVYLGSDPDWKHLTPQSRKAARAWLELSHDRPVVAFVGGLGHDSRKGFDTLWRAWTSLCRSSTWDADLVVAGGGRAMSRWQAEAERSRLGARIRFLGFTERIPEVLAASDLLVSPVRYESYGLNVQEALCFGIPAIVSASAGVAERFLPEATELLLPDPEDHSDLAARILNWRSDICGWQRRIKPTTRILRAHTWDDMAQEIVSLAERTGAC
jgi:glycosyltransferase involved in cell wall biosynthesis